MKTSTLVLAASDAIISLTATIVIALLVAWILLQFIQRARMTPEEKEEIARQKEERRLRVEQMEKERLAKEKEWEEQEQQRQRAEAARRATLPPKEETHALKIYGGLLLAIGLLVFFIGVTFDTGIAIRSSEVTSVNNLGLMLDRLIIVLSGLSLGFTGSLCLIADQVRSSIVTKARKQQEERAGEALA